MSEFTGKSGRLWQFYLDRPIGEPSGMGSVFEGSSDEGVTVAVKQLSLTARRGDDFFANDRELEIYKKVNGAESPRLMKLLDSWTTDDDIFLVMPMADYSLTAIAKSTVDLTVSIPILKELALCLKDMHAINVLHRDLKPGNILLVDGQWQLADFGISRDLDAETDTFTFALARTNFYWAPELWLGHHATFKSDLYAFGVIAYQLLCGFLPFDGLTRPIYEQHINKNPEMPTTIPSRYRKIILELLSKSPDMRPNDLDYVAQQFSLDLGDTPVNVTELANVLAKKRQVDEETATLRRRAVEEEQFLQIERDKAFEDLKLIVTEAKNELKKKLEIATIEESGKQLSLIADGVGLNFLTWNKKIPTINNNLEILLAGEIGSKQDGRRRYANILFRRESGRKYWMLEEFKVNIYGVYQYEKGTDPHGFSETDFFEQFDYVNHPTLGSHIWVRKESELTVQSIIDIYTREIRSILGES